MEGREGVGGLEEGERSKAIQLSPYTNCCIIYHCRCQPSIGVPTIRCTAKTLFTGKQCDIDCFANDWMRGHAYHI